MSDDSRDIQLGKGVPLFQPLPPQLKPAQALCLAGKDNPWISAKPSHKVFASHVIRRDNCPQKCKAMVCQMLGEMSEAEHAELVQGKEEKKGSSGFSAA